MIHRACILLLSLVLLPTRAAHSQPAPAGEPPAAAQPQQTPQPIRKPAPTAPPRRAVPVAAPTEAIGGPGAELESAHAEALRATEEGLKLLGDKKKEKEAKTALEAARDQWHALVKQAETITKQQASKASELEKISADKLSALGKADSVEAKRAAIAESTEAQQTAARQRQNADAMEGSIHRQVEALKEFEAGIRERSTIRVRGASGVLSFEVRRISILLAPPK